MDIVNQFREYLLREKKKPSKVTIKNYVSDVRRFIAWYEKTYKQPFLPELLSSEITSAYQDEIIKSAQSAASSTSSTKRYISSLRKFSRFLADSGAIEANPFDISTPVQKISDPWMLKQFKNHLELQNASKLTIKNYIIDIQQFLTWLTEVTKDQEHIEIENRFLQIDHFAVSQYKNRLLHEAKLSPPSINRKLSSLRRYLRWLSEKGVLAKEEGPQEPEELQLEQEPSKPEAQDMPLTALLELPREKESKQPSIYSSFAPVRLAQKTAQLAKLGLGFLVLIPLTKSNEAIEYMLWKKNGKQIFTPVKSLLEQSGHVVTTLIKEEPTVKSISTASKVIAQAGSQRVRFGEAGSLMKDFINSKATAKPYAIRNISKAFYAPLKISLTHLPLRERLLHHLQYTRPEWYKTYHSYPVVHHFHLGILLLATSTAGLGIFYTAIEKPQDNQTVFAALPNGPPRTLSFQGRLTDTNNNPITAATALRFSLYNSDTASGAAMLWQEVQVINPTPNGSFNADLGKQARISQELFSNNPNLYIGMTIENNDELKPRQQLPTTEYAANAQALQGLKPITEDSDVTENVILALDSSGDLTIGGASSPTFQATGGEFTLSGQALSLTTIPGSNGNITLAPDGSGIIDVQRPFSNSTDYNNLGNSGGAVRIQDELDITSISNNRTALSVNQNGSGDIISGFSNGTAKFRLDTVGNALFAGNMVINGNTIGTGSTSFGIANNNVINLSIGTNASAISLGASSGITSINNSLEVGGTTTLRGAVNTSGLLTANAGLAIPEGQTLTIRDFAPGAVPYINSTKQLAEDLNFKWNDISNALNIHGSLCIKATAGNCSGSTAGTIYAANATVQAADLAENYISAEQLEPGDIVTPEGKTNSLAIVKSDSAYQPQVIGIVSTKPGFVLNSDAQTTETHPYIYPLALQGRVPVKVTASNGEIKAGDPLTSSPIPGVAMKATKSGQTIGKALESFECHSGLDPESIDSLLRGNDKECLGKIMVFVNLSYHQSSSTITATGDLSLAETLASSESNTIDSDIKTLKDSLTITNGVIEGFVASLITAADISTQSLQVMSDNVKINGQELRNYITLIVNDVMDQYLEEFQNTNIANGPIVTPSPAATQSAQMIADTTATASASHSASESASLAQALKILTASRTAETTIAYNGIASESASNNLSGASHAARFSEPADSSSSSSQLADLTNRIDFLESQMDFSLLTSHFSPPAASSAAELGLDKLESDDVTISNTLMTLGRTTLSDVGITGNVTIGLLSIKGLDNCGASTSSAKNNLSLSEVEGCASINTSAGPLKLQAHGLHGIDFLDGKMALDAKGNLKVNGTAFFAKDVTVKGTLATNVIAPIPGSDITVQNENGKDVVRISEQGDIQASGSGSFANLTIIRGVQADTSRTVTHSDASAGDGIIRAHEIERTIYTPYITEKSLVYVTATSNTMNVTPYVARQAVASQRSDTEGSFTVQIPYAVSKDITFNWWIVN